MLSRLLILAVVASLLSWPMIHGEDSDDAMKTVGAIAAMLAGIGYALWLNSRQNESDDN